MIPTQPIAVAPSGGRVLRAFGDEVRILFGSDDTGGRSTVFITTVPPGNGPPPHYHDREDECFHVLDGDVEFYADRAWRAVPVGGTVFAPRGSVHTFRNVGDRPLRMLIQTTPGGFDRFFANLADACASTAEPDAGRIAEIAAAYGIHFVDE